MENDLGNGGNGAFEVFGELPWLVLKKVLGGRIFFFCGGFASPVTGCSPCSLDSCAIRFSRSLSFGGFKECSRVGNAPGVLPGSALVPSSRSVPFLGGDGDRDDGADDVESSQDLRLSLREKLLAMELRGFGVVGAVEMVDVVAEESVLKR